MPKIKVILNPLAGKGHAARISPIIAREFTALGADFDLVHTTARGDAINLARQALDDGFDIIVGVGGDGTSHEVVNGMMAHANGGGPIGTLGCIPAGSGNDFAVMAGAQADVAAACKQIVGNATRLVDVGEVTLDGRVKRYFDNAVGVGFDGLVTLACMHYKYVRGLALYLPAVLETVFLRMKRTNVRIEFDGQVIEQNNMMTVIANGPREGGGFLVAPEAQVTDGAFDLVIAQAMPRLQVLGLIPAFLKGTHMGDPRIRIVHARHVVMTSDDPLYPHIDGEILLEKVHRVEARMIPGALRMIAPVNGS